MLVSPVTNGLLGYGFVLGGFVAAGTPAVVVLYPVDPRQGTILDPDTDAAAVDPRQGTVIN
jgi:hypothetical protein